MGLNLKLNRNEVERQINAAVHQCRDPRMDGFTTWGIKQDLYQVLWCVEEALRRCPKYAPEQEWLKEQEKQKVIRILKDGTA